MSSLSHSKILAVIPARGGSKSIPRKNLKLVAGKPLVVWSIELALASKLIDRVVVSTDDREIQSLALKAGAESPFLRPKHISDDLSDDFSYLSHALDFYNNELDFYPNFIVNLRPTHPFRRVSTVDSAIKLLQHSPNVDSVRSVRLSKHSPYKMWTINSLGMLSPVASLSHCKEPYNTPRQLLPLAFWQDGYVDVVSSSCLNQHCSSTGANILPFIIEEDTPDIDYPEDLAQAEKFYSLLNHFPSSSHSDLSTRHPS